MPESFQTLKIFDASDLEARTSEGWKFRGTITVQDEDWCGYENGAAISRPRSTDKVILAQPRNWTARDLRTEIRRLELQVVDLQRANTVVNIDLQKEKSARATEVARFDQNASDDREERARLRALAKDESAQKRKLEVDMAKVRSAIGDLKWNEIVGPNG